MTLAVLLVPAVAALLIALSRGAAGRALALISTMTTFVIALFLPGDPGVSVPWIPAFGAYFELSPAGAASTLILTASLVMIPTVLYAGIKIEERAGAFLALLLAMQAGLNGLFLAKDLVVYYIFWEATLIPSVLMLGIWGGAERRRAALKYLIYAVAGSFFMLVTILAIKPLSGAESYRIADLLAVTPNLPATVQTWLFVGFTLAFAVKLPLWPLHAWLPDFHEQNHASGVADVAGTLYKVGGFGFFAWALPLLPLGAQVVTPILIALAAFTAVYAAMIATTQTHMKRMLAYASLSHMGIVGVGVFGMHVAGLNGAMFLLAAQMISTGGLFLISGMLFERKGSFDLDDYGGLAKSAPLLTAISLFILFTSIGVPGLANFPGEFLSLMGGFQTNPLAASFATLSVIVAGVYGVNFFQRVYQGEEKQATAELNGPELLILIPIISGILWLGLNPNPRLEQIEVQAQLVTEQLELSSNKPDLIAGGRK